ncbi:MAG: ankyrin repeat domain-containing protein [Endozoicomonas sp.]
MNSQHEISGVYTGSENDDEADEFLKGITFCQLCNSGQGDADTKRACSGCRLYLFLALDPCNATAVETLINAGANPSATSPKAGYILNHLAKNKDVECFGVLLKNGANPEPESDSEVNEGLTVTKACIKHECYGCLDLLIDKQVKLDPDEGEGESVLIFAIQNSRHQAVSMLLAAKVSPTAKSGGISPVQAAALARNSWALLMLEEYGVSCCSYGDAWLLGGYGGDYLEQCCHYYSPEYIVGLLRRYAGYAGYGVAVLGIHAIFGVAYILYHPPKILRDTLEKIEIHDAKIQRLGEDKAEIKRTIECKKRKAELMGIDSQGNSTDDSFQPNDKWFDTEHSLPFDSDTAMMPGRGLTINQIVLDILNQQSQHQTETEYQCSQVIHAKQSNSNLTEVIICISSRR